ncbi:Structural maintenance of chromosomes protein 5 [Dirofilaria immitis]|nr:Structural maintenance of chromosomes protein 5 [Dirofilaria immitis]
MEIFPGPNLNIIVGPNGTGKSTIMCGLCLAVGGTPKLLGRSELLADYIKYGSDKGSIKVFIRDSKLENDRALSIVLHRSAASDFFVDDEKVTQTKLRNVAESYNIQVDNPCTFLAQDKVKSFAEQNLEDCLNSVQSELTTLVPLIENYRRRETMRERIRLLQCKQLYLKYLDAEAIADEKAQYKQVKEKELEETEALMLPVKFSVQQQKIAVERQKCKEKNAETEKLLAAESVDELVNIECEKDYERAKKEHDEWEERLSSCASRI